MKKRLARRFGVIGLLGLVFAAAATVAPATPTTASACARLSAYRAVFPAAGAVRFKTRSPLRRAANRAPFKDRKCGGFWTTYAGYRGTQSTADVAVTLYKTRQDAVSALWEPLYGPELTFPNGVRVRTRVHELATDSGVVSLVGNVIVSSTGVGPHDGTYSGAEANRAQLRIHRRIHAAVLLLR